MSPIYNNVLHQTLLLKILLSAYRCTWRTWRMCELFIVDGEGRYFGEWWYTSHPCSEMDTCCIASRIWWGPALVHEEPITANYPCIQSGTKGCCDMHPMDYMFLQCWRNFVLWDSLGYIGIWVHQLVSESMFLYEYEIHCQSKVDSKN